MSTGSFLRRLFGNGGGERRVEDLLSLCQALLAESGEYASMAIARDALDAYRVLDEREREAFFDELVSRYSPAPEAVARAAALYQSNPSPEQLIELRKTLLKGLRAHPAWKVIDFDLMHLLRSWFNRGFLKLERIDWRTPALLLEKLIDYEAVHAIRGWWDLRRRLEGDRRCFAFFHPQLPDEPIIFIEVALTRGMSAQVQPLLDKDSPVGSPLGADCAMFYSITNCQEGLRGISFGNLLIKQVAEELKREFPHLRRFATLSPIPGFRRWLGEVRLSAEDRAQLARIDDPAWHLGEVPETLQKLLSRLCAHYLLLAKQGPEPLDPVARFHLGNGAALERLNWMGDSSEQGMSRSAGLMVNYVYWLAELEKNHERYFREHFIAASPVIEKLAREAPVAPAVEKGAA